MEVVSEIVSSSSTCQGGGKSTFTIVNTAYQQHFNVSNDAAFQVVGLTLKGSPGGTRGGGVVVNGAQCMLGTQDAAFSNIYYGPAMLIDVAQKVHLR